MKYHFIVICFLSSIVIFNSCKDKGCECSGVIEPLKIVFLDSIGNNLLDPKNIKLIEVNKLSFSSSDSLGFRITDSIDHEFPIYFYYLIINYEYPDNETFDKYRSHCLGSPCEIYINYRNRNEKDTISTLIEEEHSIMDGCPCVGYPIRYTKVNGIDAEYETEHYTGAIILRK